MAPLPLISLAPMVLPEMCRGLSAVHCLIPRGVASSLQAKAHSSSPGSPLTSHTVAHRERGPRSLSPTHATPSTAVVVGEDMVDYRLRINITAMVRFDCMYSNWWNVFTGTSHGTKCDSSDLNSARNPLLNTCSYSLCFNPFCDVQSMSHHLLSLIED